MRKTAALLIIGLAVLRLFWPNSVILAQEQDEPDEPDEPDWPDEPEGGEGEGEGTGTGTGEGESPIRIPTFVSVMVIIAVILGGVVVLLARRGKPEEFTPTY